jgi:outer membrane protein OmpA-like peptidoglycan-associated protein
MNRNLTTSGLLSSMLLGACATTAVPPPALVEARDVVRSTRLDVAVLTHAPLELKKASESLASADRLQEQGQGLDEVNSAAYIARQQARTAMAVARAKGNDLAIAGSELERERARADRRSAETRTAQAQTSVAQAQAMAARSQADDALQQAAGAELRASGAQTQVALAQAGADDANAQAAAIRQRLADLQAKATERGMLVTLGDVLFEPGSAEVRPGAQPALRKLADFLQQYPQRRVLIEGHTDSAGSAASNTALSQRRAQAVNRALDGMGVAADRATAIGYGEDYPVADNSTSTNRALNRRVEVYIAEGNEGVRPRR